MKKIISILSAAILAVSVLSAQTPDSTRFDALGAKLDEYFLALEGESDEVRNQECDFIISTCKDSLVRQWVALYAYNHYLSSNIMGEESTAVHLAKEWFISGKIPMQSEVDLMNAKIFVEFNKSSLIGMEAPELTLKDHNGLDVKVPAKDAYSLLFFYDTSCASCKLESAKLKSFLTDNTFPLEFFAIYTGQDEAAWGRYRSVDLNVKNAKHLWDPSLDSDFQLKYGVLQTPQMVLVNNEGRIIGRKLDTSALGTLLSREGMQDGDYVYGDPLQMDFYYSLFSQYGDTLKSENVDEIASYIAERTMGEGDMEQYKQMEGDLLYFLYSNRGEGFKAGTDAFIDKYILGVEDVWTEPEDTANVLSLAYMMKDLLNRTPIGEQVPDLKVPGVLRRRPCLFRKGSKSGEFKLRKLRESYVVFYSEGCTSCAETLSAVDSMIKENKKAKILLVNMDEIMENDTELGNQLLETFDLSVMPYIIKLSRKGIVERKYIDL